MTAFEPSLKLYRYLMDEHWKDGALVGPDPGIRLNYRAFRFVKSYLRGFPWRDDLYYLQAQGYWTLANARLYETAGESYYRDIVSACADTMLQRQRPDGAWDYPNPEWRGRVATAEGVWAGIGLVEAYRQTQDKRYLDGALRWHDFMMEHIGFHEDGAQLAIHYFAGGRPERIPNNSAFAIRFLAELSDVLNNSDYCATCTGMLDFLFSAQKTSGELPYAFESAQGGKAMPHFQCYQYNAFQCLDLMRYYQLTDDRCALPIIHKLLNFLETGVTDDGHVAYECGTPERTVTYHTAVVAAALQTGTDMGLGDYQSLADLCYGYVLSQQREDGSFPHSFGDYRVLSDLRSYPRYLAMILFHLLHRQPVTESRIAQGVEA